MNWPLWMVFVGLFGVSIAFNECVGIINKRSGNNHPLASFGVVIGTSYTIAGAWLADGDSIGVWTLFLCFVASGLPMIMGDILRWLSRVPRSKNEAS